MLLKEGVGLVMKKPAAAKAKTQKSQQSNKKKTTTKKSTSITSTVTLKIDKPTLKINGPFKEQSYITHMSPPRPALGCTRKQVASHFKLLEKVLAFIKHTPNCTKQQAVDKRNELVGSK